MKLLHISDLHYRMQYKSSNKAFAYDSIFPNMVPPMQQLDICLQKMGEKEREQLSAVLISGDMTEYGTQEDYKQLHTEIEKRCPDIPIIVMSAKVDVEDKVSLLLGGAVDYVTKPFDTKELLARITVALRVKTPSLNRTLEFEDITLDTFTYEVFIEDKKVKLTRTEYAILKLLIQNP